MPELVEAAAVAGAVICVEGAHGVDLWKTHARGALDVTFRDFAG